jgi:hypothetical protein
MHSTFSCNRETMANPKRVYSNADDFTSLETFIAPFNAQGRTESAALLIWFLQTIYRLDEVDAEDAVCDIGAQPDGVAGANDAINWLKHGEIVDARTGKRRRYETATIEQLEAIVVIYRGITKFEAIFPDQKTPQILSFKNWVGPHVEKLEV